jgi:Ca-activated chloride channel family protein
MNEFLNNFHFLRPYAFLALLPLIYWVIKNYRQQTGSIVHWQKICDPELLLYLLENDSNKNGKITFWLTTFCATLAIFSLAAPTWERLPVPAFRNNSALVIALNLSESMNAQDVKPSRLIRTRYKISDLLSQRKDGQTALLVYSNAAFTVTPLTNDIQTIESQLEALTTDIMPAEGNNALAGLEKAVMLLKQAGLPQGHILLITDSANNATDFAKKLSGYRLSVLGTGTSEGAPVALPEGGFAKDESGQILVPKLQSTQLSELAAAGFGVFQVMTDDDSDVKNLLKTFDSPINQTVNDKTNLFLEQWEDSGYYLILLILPWAAWQFRKGAFYLAILFFLPIPKNSYALELQNLWKTPDQQAQKIYQKHDYAKAAEKFENTDWKAAAQYQAGDFENATKHFEQSKNFYNLGNALAKKGQLQEALTAYEQAITENPYDNDAKANKELVAQALEKQKEDEKPPQDSKQNQPQQNEKSSKDSQKKQDENKSSESKPEQKDEHKSGKNPDKKEDSKQNESKKESQPEPEKPAQAKKQVEAQKVTTEQAQANEQWLKRIPDDPATLLKRKFKYQYSRQE